MIPIVKMWDRIDITRSDSETALFYDLLFLGEMVTKLIVAGLLSLVDEDRERQRYALEYTLVRANSIGDWVTPLDELTTGPASTLMPDGAVTEKRQLTQRFAKSDGTWEREAVDLLQSVVSCVGESPGGLGAKSALLTWFKTFAWLRNRTRGHGAPTGRVCAQMAPDLEASLRLITENYAGFSEPWTYLRRNLSDKYRVVPVCGDVSTFDYLKTVTDVQLSDGLYRGIAGQLYEVPLIYSDVDLSDFKFANGNFRAGRFETLSYLTDDLDDVETERYNLPASALPLSGTSAGPSLEVVGETFVNLPPRLPDYVSRSDLENTVTRLVTDDRHPVVTLAGRGGVGKTSTALEVLYQVARTGQFFAILWFSARDIDLLPQGPKRVQADVLTEKEIASQFVELMNPAGSASREFDQVAYFRNCLDGRGDDGPFLFVFDNFETVRDSSDLYHAVDTYIRLPNKVLITSRSRTFRGDFPIDVGGMTRAEFTELATGTAHRLGIAHLLNDGFLDELYEESDGHPYVVRVLLGEVAESGGRRSVERVMAGRDDILDALFERTYTSLAPAAQRIFLTLASWRSIVPRLAVEAALLRPENERMDVDRAIDTLERNSLIEVLQGPATAEEFLRVPLAAGVFGRKKLSVSSMKTAIEADTRILQMFGAARPDEATKGIGPPVDRMVAALAARGGQGDDIQEGLKILEFVGRQFPSAWLKIADLEEELGEPASATEAVRKYLEAEPSSREGWSKLANLCARSGASLDELAALCELAQLPGATIDDASRAANRFNALMASRAINLRGDDKRVMAQRIRALLERRANDSDATTLSRLAWLCLHLDDVPAARKYADLGLKADPMNTYCIRLADQLSGHR